ncbi:alpha/beta fold hydrolase [Kribbella sp. NPDC051587]|uniref:alpha/beta fold hydrolase n=1 Tax=Kribbella sp. NPDC051587 TaxID=3364119 RepID=UPI00379CB2BF
MSAFDRAYDELFARWGVPVERLELAGKFGITAVNACGSPDAAPLVLLAGHGATSAVWRTVATALARTHRVYAIDLIGDAGRSTLSGPRPKTTADLVGWLSDVLTGLGAERASFIGHSYGAWLALTYALAAPDRVDRLALIDPTDCFTRPSVRYVAKALPLLLRPSEARSEAFLRWEIQGVDVDPAWLHLAGLAAVQPAASPVRPRRPSVADLAGLQAELLVIVADRSKAHDPRALATRAAAAGGHVVHIEEATHHSLPASHAAELVPALTSHFA